MALLDCKSEHSKEKNIKSKIAYLGKSVGGKEGKVERYFPRSAVTRNDVSALWSSKSMYFFSPYYCKSEFFSSISQPSEGCDFTSFGDIGGGKKLVYVSHLHSETAEDRYEKRLTTYVLILHSFHFGLYLNSFVCLTQWGV